LTASTTGATITASTGGVTCGGVIATGAAIITHATGSTYCSTLCAKLISCNVT
jgi:hypothetical protein